MADFFVNKAAEPREKIKLHARFIQPNTMVMEEGNFEKGEHFGSIDTLELLKQILDGIPVSGNSNF